MTDQTGKVFLPRNPSDAQIQEFVDFLKSGGKPGQKSQPRPRTRNDDKDGYGRLSSKPLRHWPG